MGDDRLVQMSDIIDFAAFETRVVAAICANVACRKEWRATVFIRTAERMREQKIEFLKKTCPECMDRMEQAVAARETQFAEERETGFSEQQKPIPAIERAGDLDLDEPKPPTHDDTVDEPEQIDLEEL